MTDFLPLFPLSLVAFPGEALNLHIFESRYKQLIRECADNKVTFGVPAIINGKRMNFGTEMKLLSIEKKHEGGELDIKTKGMGLFEIKTFFETAPGKLYSGADIQRIDLGQSHDTLYNDTILNLLDELFEVLKIKKPIPKNRKSFTLWELAHHVGFSIAQEYKFLTITDMQERQAFMIDHLEALIPVVQEMERLKKRVEMNGHFKKM